MMLYFRKEDITQLETRKKSLFLGLLYPPKDKNLEELATLILEFDDATWKPS